MAINWDDAPEGTTHAFREDAWRKVTEDDVLLWARTKREWLSLDPFQKTRPENWVRRYVREGAAIKRPEPVENPLPNGLEWFEDATHWNPHGQDGFFFNEEDYFWEGEWRSWEGACGYWRDKPETIKRFPEGVKQQEPKPEPKKPVGWWS